jgi:hypothetical protein
MFSSPSARRLDLYEDLSYSLKVEDYLPLCPSCHSKYDGHPEMLAEAKAAREANEPLPAMSLARMEPDSNQKEGT